MQNACPRAVLNSAICQKNEPARYRSLCCIVYAAEIDRLHGKLRPGSLPWNLRRLTNCLKIPQNQQKQRDFLQKLEALLVDILEQGIDK